MNDAILGQDRSDLFIGTDQMSLSDVKFSLKFPDLLVEEVGKQGTNVQGRVDNDVVRMMSAIISYGMENLTDFPRNQSDYVRNAIHVYTRLLRSFIKFKNTPRLREVWAMYLMKELDRAATGDRNQIRSMEQTFAKLRDHVVVQIRDKQFTDAARTIRGYFETTVALAELDPEKVGLLMRKIRVDQQFTGDVEFLKDQGFEVSIPSDQELGL